MRDHPDEAVIDAYLLREIAATTLQGDVLQQQINLVGTLARLYRRELRVLREIRDTLVSHE
jgi:hypothetical protein